VNKKKKRWKKINEDQEEEWEKYFKGLLGGVERRVVGRIGGEKVR